MTNTEKKLDALIDALGFDVEEVRLKIKPEHLPLNGFGHHLYDTSGTVNGYYLSTHVVDYKLTKRNFNSKPSLHKLVRQYEQGTMSYGKMLGRIVLIEPDYENI